MIRKETKTFFISTEGDSELFYLDRLAYLINSGDYPYKVKFIKKKANPVSFVKCKSDGYTEFPYFHICDKETNSIEDNNKFICIIDNLREASKIKGIKYNLSYTNMCFELWLILHKKQLKRKLIKKESYKDEINLMYEFDFYSWDDVKKEENIKKLVSKISMEDVKSAIDRAKEICNENNQNYFLKEYKKCNYYNENPSLSIHDFVEFVLKKCGVI